MTRASSASTPKSRGKRESNTNNSKAKKKGNGKRGGDEGRPSGAQGNVKKMDSPAVQRAKRDIKIRRLTQVQINALEKAFDEANGKLSHPQKVEIAKGIGLEARQVAIWFQNRRAKWRTEQVENQYDVLKQQNDRLSDENDKLRRELEDMRVALAAARAGISHPMASRMEVVAGTGGSPCFRSKNGESPASVLEKVQHLFRSMKRRRSAFHPDPHTDATWEDSASSDGGEWESADSANSDESSGTESLEEEKQPVKRARRSSLQKREFTPPSKGGKATPKPNGVGKSAKKASAVKTLPPRQKDPPKGNLQREHSLGRRRGSKLEALKLPAKLNPFADKDRFNSAPTPKMGGPFKPGAATPGSAASMLLGPPLDPSPTTGPLANGEAPGGEGSCQLPITQGLEVSLGDSADNPAALSDKRGFSHLVYGTPESSPTESSPNLSAYFFPEARQSSPTLTGGGPGAGKTTPPGPSPLGEVLQLAPPPSDSWGEALLQAEQPRGQASRIQPPAGQGLKSEEVTELPTEVPCDFEVGGKEYGRSPPPSPFPNTAAQDFLAKYRAAYGDNINRASNEAPGNDSLLAFVNGTEDGSAKDEEWRQGEDGLHAALEGGATQLDALAVLDMAGGGGNGALEAQGTPPEDNFLELSLDSFGGREAAARGPPTSSPLGVFRGGGGLLDPYQDPRFPERSLSPSLPKANGQHQGGHVFLDLEEQDERAPQEMAGPLTPRLGGQVQQGIPPWLTAVAINGLWGDSGSPGAQAMGCWTQLQTGQ